MTLSRREALAAESTRTLRRVIERRQWETGKRRALTAFTSLLQYDLLTLARSWVVRFWFALTLIGGIAAVLVSRNYTEPTSFFISWTLVLYAGLGSFVALILSTSAISSERPFLGPAIISRGIAPTPYLLAKLVSRSLYILGMFLIVIAPTMFFVQIQGETNDMVVRGMLLSLLYWSLMLAVLSFFGITVSVVFTNTLLGVVVLGVFWYLGLLLLASVYAGELTPHGVLGGLPLVLQGESLLMEVYAILVIGVLPLVILPIIAIRRFNTRDL